MWKDSRVLLLLLQSRWSPGGWAGPVLLGSQPICPLPGSRGGQVLLAISDTLSQSFITTSPRLGYKISPDLHFRYCLSSLKEPMPFLEILGPTLRVRIPFFVLSGGIMAPLLFHRCKLDSSVPRSIEFPKLYL